MRIGELLLESEIVNAKQLQDALHYARAKELPLGRCLKILRLLTEHDLERALETQKLIRNGLDQKVGAQILNIAVKHGLSVRQALMERSKFMQIKVDPQKAAAPEVEQEEHHTISPIKPTKSAFALIQEADRLFAEEKVHEAERKYLEARDQLLKEHGHECTEIASVQVKIANLYMTTDRYDEAEQLYSDVLQSYVHLRGPEDPLVAKSFEDLGDLNHIRGRPGPAKDYFTQAYDITKRQKPLDITIAARLLKKLASVSENTDSKRKKLGEFCLDAGLLMNSEIQYALKQAKAQVKPIGAVLRDEKFLQPEQIDSLMLAQLLTKKNVLPYDIAVLALNLSHKAGIGIKYICDIGRIGLDNPEDSAQYKQLVLEQDNLLTAERLLGPTHYEVAVIAERLADLFARASDVPSAVIFYKQAQTILERAVRGPGDSKHRIASVMLKCARMMAKEGREMEAEPIFMHALETMQLSGKGESLEAAECLHELALIHKAQHNLPSALSFMNTAAALYEKLGCDAAALPVLEDMVKIQTDNNMFNESETTLQRLISWAQRQYGPFEPETAAFIEQLGDLYQSMGRPHQAHSQYHFAMQIYERTKGCEQKFKILDQKLAASRGM